LDETRSAFIALELIDLLRPDWHRHAACRGRTSLMFPVAPSQGSNIDFRSALAFCQICPVVDPCRQASVHEENGVWGGMVRERKQNADEVLRMLRHESGWWTPDQVAFRMGWSERNARRRLLRLLDRGLVEVVTTDRDGYEIQTFMARRETP